MSPLFAAATIFPQSSTSIEHQQQSLDTSGNQTTTKTPNNDNSSRIINSNNSTNNHNSSYSWATHLMQLSRDQSLGLHMLRLILSVPSLDVHQTNARGENAVLWCVKHCCVQPSRVYVVVVALLLRAGVSKSVADHAGFTPLTWLDSAFIGWY
jgi:hypothetical protein